RLLAAQSLERRADRGRVMREILVQPDARENATLLEPAPHTFELRERLERDVDADAGMNGTAHGGERILEVVGAEQGPADLADLFPAPCHAEARFRADQLIG